MANELPRRLPLVVKGENDESGLSFIYRTFLANGISFREGQRWLRLKSWNPLHAINVSALAWIAGVDRTWLAHRTIVNLGQRPARRYAFMAHEFGEGITDYLHGAKLCPACVKRRKSCRAAWHLRCVCGCAEHDLVLLERCPHCRNLVAWNRPAIDICACGNFLTAADKVPKLPTGISDWIRWIEIRLAHASAIVPASDFGLPPLLSALSIDGAYRLVLGTGLFSSPNESPALASSRARTSAGLAEVIARGLDRLASLGGNCEGISLLEPIIHVPTLERMRMNGVTPGDTRCANVLIDQLRSAMGSPREKRGHHNRGQLCLPW